MRNVTATGNSAFMYGGLRQAGGASPGSAADVTVPRLTGTWPSSGSASMNTRPIAASSSGRLRLITTAITIPMTSHAKAM